MTDQHEPGCAVPDGHDRAECFVVRVSPREPGSGIGTEAPATPSFGRAFGKAMAATNGDARLVNTILRIAWDDWGGAAGAVEGADPLRAALIEIRDTAYDTNDECRYCDSDIEEDHPEDCPASIALSALVRATTPEAPASPPPLDEHLLDLAITHADDKVNDEGKGASQWVHYIAAEYSRLASAASSEPGEPESARA